MDHEDAYPELGVVHRDSEQGAQEIVELLPSLVVRLLGWPFIERCDDAGPPPVETLAVALSCLLGILVEDLSRSNRNRFNTDETEGVIITEVKKQSYLDRIGVHPGDIIRKIDDIPIKDTEDFKKAVIKYRKKPSIVLLLQRENQLYYLTVKLG